ncbi:MAG: ribonuclease HI [Treponema sp.]
MTTTTIELYTDGACSQNPGPGGWAFVIILRNGDEDTGTELLRGAGADKATTNNRMELLAVIEALQAYRENLAAEYGGCPVTLYTDSQYVQQGISSWIKKWKHNGWKTASKQPVKNQDLWQPLDRLAEEIQPVWKWVKGHAGNYYNELCDSLAVEEVLKIR